MRPSTGRLGSSDREGIGRMDGESRATPSDTGRNLALWAGCLTGPVAWFLQLEITYAIAAETSGSKARIGLHLVTLASLALVGGGAWAA